MSDIADLANDRAAEILQDALAARQRAAEQRGQLPGLQDCEACDNPIPPERQVAMPGARLCVTCQERLERGMAR